MRKIIYSVAASLDGFVAGPNGEADWIAMDPEFDFTEIMTRFDTIIMGRRTFEAAQALGGGESMPGVKVFLVSNTLRQEDHPDLTIISGQVGEKISQLRATVGKDIWLFGGGTLFRSLLDLGLVDAVEVAVMPVLLGSGIPLVANRSARTSLQLTNSRIYKTTGTVALEYAVERLA